VVKGLKKFREHFADYTGSFVVIGGVACDEWLVRQGLTFRATRDVDMVLIVESLSAPFVKRFWEFIHTGDYSNIQRSTGKKVFYRFGKPASSDCPALIELFSRRPLKMDLAAGQTICPVPVDEDLSSLSAILMEDDYYQLILENRVMVDDLPIITATALIPLKARAWLDLTQRQEEGKPADEDDIRKHRRDVFRLAAALPAGAGPAIPPPVLVDLRKFMAAFSLESPEWSDLQKSLRADLGAAAPPSEALLAALRDHFRL
jgi:hypothetical protein